ncbi:MAG: hypothetical protein E6G76_00120 [Alphaproteobacteria bacterium]|jgi:hypothetical protein|nr:MAG: hypothetical protein E6G76_00120 [Alphaproteobacteria bacterium]
MEAVSERGLAMTENSIPTLDQRVTLYLRAVHGEREYTAKERSAARIVLLDTMAKEGKMSIGRKVLRWTWITIVSVLAVIGLFAVYNDLLHWVLRQ